MTTIITRAGKGSPLTNNEMDANLNNLNNDKVEVSVLATYAPLASPTFTGDPRAPNPAPGDNDTTIATTSFVNTAFAGKAPINNPVFTGTVTVPDQTAHQITTSVLPASRPSLNLDFANSDVLDPRITFTRTSTATYVGRDGLLKTAAVNEPRRAFDPVTKAPLGLLMEEARTNSITHSNDFSNATEWSVATNITRTYTIADPWGGTTATTLTASAAAATFGATSTGTIGDVWTASFWIRRRTGVGPLTMYAGDNASIPITSQVTSEWKRITVTGTAITSTIVRCYITIATSGDEIDIWGAQLEAGSGPTSYIPTVAATVTRAKDDASMTGTNFSSWYNQSEGSFVVSYQANIVTGATISQQVFDASDATRINTIQAYKRANADTSRRFGITKSGAAESAFISTGVFTTAREVIAAAYKVNDAAVSVSGGAVVTDNLVEIPTVIDRLGIGSTSAGAGQLIGTIAYIRYYPTRLTNAQLQGLSK